MEVHTRVAKVMALVEPNRNATDKYFVPHEAARKHASDTYLL